MGKRIGKQTVEMCTQPRIIGSYSIVGPKEGEGPVSKYFDLVLSDDTNGKDSYEKAESSMLYDSVTKLIEKAGLKEGDINYLLAGDLLNQLTSASFAARDISIPFIGLYGACSTMTESLSIASMIMDGGFADYVIGATSSHFSAAERQFRFPLEYGSQRSKTAQWTVTGAGAFLLAKDGDFPKVTHVTTGLVKDYGIKDANNMGAAMAPAAVDTLNIHFKDRNIKPNYYDLIVTGDLGIVGKKLTIDLMKDYGYNLSENYIDSGEEIFFNDKQNTGSGGSGCGCSAVFMAGYIYKNLIAGNLKRVLLISTGALMSTTSSLQGESIPGIAHAVSIEV